MNIVGLSARKKDFKNQKTEVDALVYDVPLQLKTHCLISDIVPMNMSKLLGIIRGYDAAVTSLAFINEKRLLRYKV